MIFVWPWNENARTKTETDKRTEIEPFDWFIERIYTNARGFWLVKRTLGWKNVMPKNFLEINRYFVLTSYCNTIGQSNNTFSILGFSLAGKRRVQWLSVTFYFLSHESKNSIRRTGWFFSLMAMVMMLIAVIMSMTWVIVRTTIKAISVKLTISNFPDCWGNSLWKLAVLFL